MPIKNYLKATTKEKSNCHGGVGIIKQHNLYESSELTSSLKFVNYSVLPPGTSIGNHKHGDNEEFYVILTGKGKMLIDGVETDVVSGDVVLNKPYGTHGLFNDSDADLSILVFEAEKK